VRPGKDAVLERERHWAIPTAIATLAAIGFLLAGGIVGTQAVGGGSADAEFLRNVDHHRSAQMIASILQAIGVALLAAPLAYLFKAAQARSERVRGQLIGVVIAAPLFLAVFDIVAGISALHAATDFVSQGISGTGDHANNAASDALTHAPLQGLAAGFGIAGKLGFVIAMVYTALHSMRVGLLSRFWGSLGIALGGVSFIFFQFSLLWFVYVAILLMKQPSGRSPAWAAGEAIPWPTPGEQAAISMGGGDGDADHPGLPEGEAEDMPSEGTPPRKRKQRS
jgi:hypothetical protein